MKFWPFRNEEQRRLDAIDEDVERRYQARQAEEQGGVAPPIEESTKRSWRSIGRRRSSPDQGEGEAATPLPPPVEEDSESDARQWGGRDPGLMSGRTPSDTQEMPAQPNEPPNPPEELIPLREYPEPKDNRALEYVGIAASPILLLILLALFFPLPDLTLGFLLRFYLITVAVVAIAYPFAKPKVLSFIEERRNPNRPAPQSSWRGGYRQVAYTVVGALSILLFLALLFSSLPIRLCIAIALLFLTGAFFYARAMAMKDDAYVHEAWQLEIQPARHPDVTWKRRQHMVFVTKHMLRNIAFVQQRGSHVIYFAGRDSWVHLLIRIWRHVLIMVVLLLIMVVLGVVSAGEVASWVFLILCIVGVVAAYQFMKWWCWIFVVTDEFVHIVRCPPRWLPWVKYISFSMSLSSIVFSTNEESFWGSWIGYGDVVNQIRDDPNSLPGETLDLSNASQFRKIKWMRQRLQIGKLITAEANRIYNKTLAQALAIAEAEKERAERALNQQHEDSEALKAEVVTLRAEVVKLSGMLQDALLAMVHQPTARVPVVVDADIDPPTDPHLPVIRK